MERIKGTKEMRRVQLGQTGLSIHPLVFGTLPLGPLQADLSIWEKLEQRKRQLKIMDNFCSGCGVCVDACASRALIVDNGRVLLDTDNCVLCGYCAPACPDFLIRVV
jgi:ferredoxin